MDDLSIGEICDTNTAVSLFSQAKELKTMRARQCEKKFNIISENAKRIGMQINAIKTQLLSIHDNRNANMKTFIDTEEGRIEDGNEMKILGFIFGQRPSVDYHVNYLANKFNNSIWSLIHLKRAKIDNCILIKVYFVMLRPILEYCHVIYHSMLSQELSDR